MRRLGKFTDPFVLEYTQTRGASRGGRGMEAAAHGTGGKMRGEARSVLTQIRAGAQVRAHVSIDRSLGPLSERVNKGSVPASC